MKVWTSLRAFKPDPERPVILALGNFDGVHRGHLAILTPLVENAKRRRRIPAVLTFSEHPQRVLHPGKGPGLLTSPQHRLLIFSQLGIETCFLLSFTQKFAQTSPEDFVHEWLVNRLHVKEVHLGYNAHFGFNRAGDVSLMKSLSERLGFQFYEAKPVAIHSQFVSSTLIRKLITEGNFDEAALFLGRPFSIFASVVRGKGRGKALGFPTANLRPHSEIFPARGVYPVEIRENCFHLRSVREEEFEFQSEKPGPWRQGVLNFGVRPTFETAGLEVSEVHILDDSDPDLLGKTVEVLFYPMLREEISFKDPPALAEAIRGDIAATRRFFNRKKSLQGQKSPIY